ncbi:M24 family metallopeptidase [Deinococcus pimensis]|uniref:M24 family metallopeptidase n=1 Tax=Deinococcus pimensis TaxID=309888 RepID=UPI00048995A5|nr:aminopeptidase P family protein [Deinococcus pimensis]
MSQFDDLLTAAGLDALWITRPEHVRLVSGFSSPRDGRVLLTRGGATLYTDARYTVQAAEESSIPQYIAQPPRATSEAKLLQHAREQFAGGRVGIEADHLSVTALGALREAWGVEIVPTRGLLEARRAVKTDAEIALLREAQRIADEAYAEVRPTITAGRRERDVALDLEIAMRRRGADAAAFDLTVASGERGAMPHGGATDRVLREGELVTIDMGALLGGYHSDMTRTVAVGEVSDELRRLYDAVLEAEDACVAAVKPGARAADLDVLARSILERHGLAGYFSHSLGHGVGLAIHEAPTLSGSSEDVLRPGMAITIEPGVYVPSVGGVRIEDLVLVTGDGHEVLSRAEKERV